jgi:DNA-binding response OmpR family regulator
MKKILFVDDESDWRSVVAAQLKEIGHETIVARNGSEAMKLADGAQLGLIILDVDLAGESGLSLMHYLRRNHPGVPVLIYTGLDHDEAAIKNILHNGAAQYLRKGTLEDLAQAVQHAFRN